VLVTGAKLFRPLALLKKFAVLGRCTVEKPISARLPPDDDLWKTGCDGLPGASDMREPDVVRMWLVVCGAWRFDWDVDRFIADAGMGIAETLFETAPSVYRSRRQYVNRLDLFMLHATDLSRPAHREQALLLRHNGRVVR